MAGNDAFRQRAFSITAVRLRDSYTLRVNAQEEIDSRRVKMVDVVGISLA